MDIPLDIYQHIFDYLSQKELVLVKFIDKTFLMQVEQGLRVTDITSVNLIANDKVDVYQYTVKAQTYWMK